MLRKNEIILLNEIRKNSRSSITEISKKINVPISTLFENLKKLEEKAIIKYTSIPDYKKINFNIIAHILVNTKRKSDIIKFLENNPHINNIERINNGFELNIQAIFSNMDELNSFLESIETFEITSKKVFYLLECIKKEGFLIEHGI